MKKSLTDIIYQYKDRDFSWGELDCCVFTVRCVEEFTEKKLPKWRDVLQYRSEKDSIKALKKLGCDKLEDLPTAILGTEKKPIKEVKLGEPVYYINEEGIGVMGICNGARAYFLQKGGGLSARNVEDCTYCWSID